MAPQYTPGVDTSLLSYVLSHPVLSYSVLNLFSNEIGLVKVTNDLHVAKSHR